MTLKQTSDRIHPDLDYMKFRRRLFARRELHWRLLSGSLFERPLLYVLTDPTDIDDLVWPSDICAVVPHSYQSAFLNHFRGTLLTVCTRGVHVGFAKLRTGDASGLVFYEKPRKQDNSKGHNWTEISKGPSEKKCIEWSSEFGLRRIYDTLCRYDECWRGVREVSIDRVEAIYCPSWPPEAAEWITRERKSGWPSRDVIGKIVELGCHLVAKPHQSTPDDDTQWRFSFSQAEVILINNLTDVQKYIYHVLRLIKSEVVKLCGGEEKTVLCTYFFKTLMLWACEEKPPEFWTDENLETSVGELLCQMIEWLIERRCPSYFIRKNNMIDHLPMYNDLSNEISSLLHYKEQCIPALLSNTPKAYPRTEFHVKVPNRALHHIYTHMIFSNIVNPLEPRMVGRLMKELTTSMDFMPVLKTLHSGITQHLKLMIYRNGRTLETTEECELLSSALNSFALAIEASDHGHSRASMSLSDSLITNAKNLTLPTFINKQPNSTDSIQLNRDRGSELEEEDRLHVKDLKLHILRTVLETIMQKSADSLTIPSFFISAAYRANFLYTGLRDYHLALRQCDEACYLLDAQQKDVVKDITRPVFHFMVTNEWSVMFDENVQTVLGFTALYRFVFNACNQGPKGLVGAARIGSTLVVRLCAMKFLCYVRRRCLRLLGKPWTVWTPFAPCNLDRLPKQPMFSENYIDLFSECFLRAALHII